MVKSMINKTTKEKTMSKNKKCVDLVKGQYQSRLNDLRNAYTNNDLDFPKWLAEYGLSWDYVVANTFDNQTEGYYRWQLSWGGPSDEFRIYTDNDKNIQSIEYWYQDWFDGASINVNDEEVENIIHWQLECDLTPMEHEEKDVA